jgi:YHS domain-containing protein
MVRDPQCGVYIPVTAALKRRMRGETVYFCSSECEDAYNQRPSV